MGGVRDTTSGSLVESNKTAGNCSRKLKKEGRLGAKSGGGGGGGAETFGGRAEGCVPVRDGGSGGGG